MIDRPNYSSWKVHIAEIFIRQFSSLSLSDPYIRLSVDLKYNLLSSHSHTKAKSKIVIVCFDAKFMDFYACYAQYEKHQRMFVRPPGSYTELVNMSLFYMALESFKIKCRAIST